MVTAGNCATVTVRVEKLHMFDDKLTPTPECVTFCEAFTAGRERVFALRRGGPAACRLGAAGTRSGIMCGQSFLQHVPTKGRRWRGFLSLRDPAMSARATQRETGLSAASSMRTMGSAAARRATDWTGEHAVSRPAAAACRRYDYSANRVQ
jgi:hypothetical protein